MRNFLIHIIWFLIIAFFISCSKRLIPGKYVVEGGKSYFEIDKNGNYYFSTSGNVHDVLMFSKGKSIISNERINFIPDSSYFFRISVLNYYFDNDLKDTRKLILDIPDSLLAKFDFSFNNGSPRAVVYFGDKRSVVYKPVLSSYQDGDLVLKAKLNDDPIILPRLRSDSIVSNSIQFFDVNDSDPANKPWNVLELKVDISRDMFAFTKLPRYRWINKRFLVEDRATYKLATRSKGNNMQ